MKLKELIDEEIELGKGQLVLVGGRPSMGKSAFAISAAVSLAERGGKIGYFSLEMSKKQWVERALKKDEFIKENLESLSIDIIDEMALDVKAIADRCRAGKEYDLIFIDYLQLLDRGDGDVTSVVIELKKMADELGCPIFVLSQLSRRIEDRENHKPTVEDLDFLKSDKGIFDKIILLYREHYYDRSADDSKMTVILKDTEKELEWNYQSISVI